MGHFRDITWRTDTAKADSKSENEPTSEEHSMACSGCLNAGANNDDGSSSEHALAAPKNIVDGTRENHCWDRADVIDGKYQAGA